MAALHGLSGKPHHVGKRDGFLAPHQTAEIPLCARICFGGGGGGVIKKL